MHQTKLKYNPLHELEVVSNLETLPNLEKQIKKNSNNNRKIPSFIEIKQELKVLMHEFKNKARMRIV